MGRVVVRKDSPQRDRGASRRRAGAGRPPSWTRAGECGGHPRGLSAGQAFRGVTGECGRATALLVVVTGSGHR